MIRKVIFFILIFFLIKQILIKILTIKIQKKINIKNKLKFFKILLKISY